MPSKLGSSHRRLTIPLQPVCRVCCLTLNVLLTPRPRLQLSLTVISDSCFMRGLVHVFAGHHALSSGVAGAGLMRKLRTHTTSTVYVLIHIYIDTTSMYTCCAVSSTMSNLREMRPSAHQCRTADIGRVRHMPQAMRLAIDSGMHGAVRKAGWISEIAELLLLRDFPNFRLRGIVFCILKPNEVLNLSFQSFACRFHGAFSTTAAGSASCA